MREGRCSNERQPLWLDQIKSLLKQKISVHRQVFIVSLMTSGLSQIIVTLLSICVVCQLDKFVQISLVKKTQIQGKVFNHFSNVNLALSTQGVFLLKTFSFYDHHPLENSNNMLKSNLLGSRYQVSTGTIKIFVETFLNFDNYISFPPDLSMFNRFDGDSNCVDLHPRY